MIMTELQAGKMEDAALSEVRLTEMEAFSAISTYRHQLQFRQLFHKKRHYTFKVMRSTTPPTKGDWEESDELKCFSSEAKDIRNNGKSPEIYTFQFHDDDGGPGDTK